MEIHTNRNKVRGFSQRKHLEEPSFWDVCLQSQLQVCRSLSLIKEPSFFMLIFAIRNAQLAWMGVAFTRVFCSGKLNLLVA